MLSALPGRALDKNKLFLPLFVLAHEITVVLHCVDLKEQKSASPTRVVTYKIFHQNRTSKKPKYEHHLGRWLRGPPYALEAHRKYVQLT